MNDVDMILSTTRMMGNQYRDKRFGLVGYVVSVHFYEDAEPKATIRFKDGSGTKDLTFPISQLEPVEQGVPTGFAMSNGHALHKDERYGSD